MNKRVDRWERLAGATDLIAECAEMLAGKRLHLTPLPVYCEQRLEYWQQRAASAAAREAARRRAA